MVSKKKSTTPFPCLDDQFSFRILLAMNKVVASADEAIRDVFDGATIMIGGPARE